RIDVKEIKEAWQRVEKIKEFIAKGEYLIILDGLEEMQKGEEKGAEFGCLKHREFIDLLKFIADVNIRGLCLITTRYPLKDIENYRALTYQNIEVEQLGLDDARALFRKFGVRGEQDEIDKVINEYDGHALSLTLLCGHIVEKFDGDIKKAGEIPSFHSDKEAGGKAHRILLWYKSQLNEEQLAFLKIFSIFRKQVTEKDFEGVFRSKMGHCLVDMSIFSFMGIVDNLCKRRLITKGQDTYTTHPLIKNYFESIFNEEDKRLCHKHIYQYIGSYAPEKPNTLEEMQPLFEQVYHGCSARLYDEVYKLYDEKICRKEEYFLQDKLSALETNLSLVKTFFPKGDLSQMPLVSKKSAQSWLLNEAGLTLLSTGRPKEAEELFIRKTNMQIEDKDWKNASVGYRNLTELQFRIGEIEKALLSAKKALELSEKAKFDQFIVYSKSYLAWILHLLGKTKEAEKGFREADELEAKISGYRLCSIRGVFYADFLISINRVDEASELTQRNLEICQRNNWPDDISRCYRTLSAIERIKENYKEACDHLQKAIEIARRVGMPSLEIKALLESGRLHLDTENYQDAISDANQVLKLCDRTGFKFYEPEAELILAKAYLAQNDLKQAKSCANSAYDKATSMHYYQPKIEAEGLVAKLSFKDSICYTK
ncbi:tetratricopeptide repeat protein, partial [bacterium]|nr:tetratricopeptide repeat protein [bacterium]MBU1599764.1 tetratricopeptide repeat protein [bacterium]